MDLDDGDEEPVARGRGRPRRSMQPNGTEMHAGGTSRRGTYSSEASDDDSEANPSSNEWNGEDENDVDEKDDDDDLDDLDMSEDEIAKAEAQDERLVVRLKYSRGSSKSPQNIGQPNGTTVIDQPSTKLPSSSLLVPDQDDDLVDEKPQLVNSKDSSSAEIPSMLAKPDETSIVQNESIPPMSTDTKQPSSSGHEEVNTRPSSSPGPPTASFQPQAFIYQDEKS